MVRDNNKILVNDDFTAHTWLQGTFLPQISLDWLEVQVLAGWGRYMGWIYSLGNPPE
jgi:hypothetical protein